MRKWLAFVCALLAFGPLSVSAQDAQLQIVIIDSDPGDKGRAYKPIAAALEGRDDVRVTSEKDFLTSAKSQGVTLETLRKGSERKKSEEPIAAAMTDAGIEVLLVIDAIKKRRWAQTVVLGPNGKELADIREKLSRLKSDKRVNSRVLDKAFDAARDEVDAHREMLAEKAEEERQAAVEAKRQQAEDSATDEVAASTETTPATEAGGPAFLLGVGGFLGQRVFKASSTSDYDIDHSTPLGGASAMLRLRLYGTATSEVALVAGGDYAPMSIEFVADGGDPFTVSGDHLVGRAEINYLYRFGSAFVRVGAGGDAVSSTLESNAYFTGTRYLAARSTIGGGVQSGALELGLDAGILGVFDNNTSNGAYGETGFGLGYVGRLGVGYALTDMFGVLLAYQARLVGVTWDEPAVASGAVDTQDLIHGGSLMITVGL